MNPIDVALSWIRALPLAYQVAGAVLVPILLWALAMVAISRKK